MTGTLVIGAGLAGLAAAYGLHRAGETVTVLEARDRIGGRALSVGGVDLGPAWFWPEMQPELAGLVQTLGLETLEQFETGDFVYEAQGGVQRGAFPARYGDAARVRGGLGAVAERLAQTLPEGAVRLGQPVTSLDLRQAPRIMGAEGEVTEAERLIIAVPPPIAATWDVTPAWSDARRAAMTRWPTWMAAHAKLVAVYDRPFWRAAGLSGSAVSHVGPLFEIADQSDEDRGLYALFGFVSWPAPRRENVDVLRAAALDHLGRLFGPEARAPQAVHVMDWAQEPYTATDADKTPPNGHPPYGEPALSEPLSDRVFFAGAELSQRHGGLVAGAVETGLAAARAVSGVLNPAQRAL